MTGNSHAEFVRFSANSLNNFELNRAVNLDLLEGCLVIAINSRLRFRCVVGANYSPRDLTVAINNAGQQHSRSESFALVERIPNSRDKLDFVTDIAHCSHTGGEIGWTPLNLLKVRVHIPQSGQ